MCIYKRSFLRRPVEGSTNAKHLFSHASFDFGPQVAYAARDSFVIFSSVLAIAFAVSIFLKLSIPVFSLLTLLTFCTVVGVGTT